MLVGRPYNIYDKSINLSVATKLSSIYGINVIPIDFIDKEGIRHEKKFFHQTLFSICIDDSKDEKEITERLENIKKVFLNIQMLSLIR